MRKDNYQRAILYNVIKYNNITQLGDKSVWIKLFLSAALVKKVGNSTLIVFWAVLIISFKQRLNFARLDRFEIEFGNLDTGPSSPTNLCIIFIVKFRLSDLPLLKSVKHESKILRLFSWSLSYSKQCCHLLVYPNFASILLDAY